MYYVIRCGRAQRNVPEGQKPCTKKRTRRAKALHKETYQKGKSPAQRNVSEGQNLDFEFLINLA